MAKRRKLEAPSAEDLDKIEKEFRRETSVKVTKAPIAQVAAEVAGQYQGGTPETRRDEAQAAAYRDAEDAGRLIREIDLDEIDATALQRDRTNIDPEALAELEHSITEHGLRLPIEVYDLKDHHGGKRFGLLSGYRRLIAQRNVLARTKDKRFAAIRAVLRDPEQMGGAFVAMVEENEIRQDLSHYERGRIAAIAAQQGAFNSTEDAVGQMFAAASKAKRSKIRSFATIFEELGDVLQFPESLKEKDGLRLAKGLREGAETPLRDALGGMDARNARTEWAAIEQVLAGQGAVPSDPRKGGRPKVAQDKSAHVVVTTAAGVTIRTEEDGADYVLRLSGDALSEDVAKRAMQAVVRVLNAR